MFVSFFAALRDAGVPVTLREHLTLIEALEADLASRRVDDFYVLARAILVKDERHFDKFDRVFAAVFRGLESGVDGGLPALPADWLQAAIARHLSAEERRAIAAMGGLDRLLEALRQRAADQRRPHQGGTTWIGSAGTSPYGGAGSNPEGVRISRQGGSGRAVKVWERREFKDLDDGVVLGTRNLQLALRRLRRFARTGAPLELDLDGTIKGSAHKGYLDLLLRPERRNAVKVLLLLDVGGSMDGHVQVSEALFTAARSEFKHLAHVYFHNCLYETVWRENRRRFTDATPTLELLHAYGRDCRVIFVGDATMSLYEIVAPGGSVEHFNAEPGQVWIERMTRTYPASVWLNPVPESDWAHTPSIALMRDLLGGRMYPLTLAGLDRAMRELAR